MKDIIGKIDMYLFEKEGVIEEVAEAINERLRIYSNSNIEKPIETRKWQFSKRNVNKLAYEYDAKVEVFDKDLKSAQLRDSKGRLLFIDGS